ncbi:hypothetical protein [Nocardia sp. NPDC004123]
MAEWVKRTFPELATRAKAEGVVILFGDQVGVRDDGLSGRIWRWRGQTRS